jgi:hypothetical protein
MRRCTRYKDYGLDKPIMEKIAESQPKESCLFEISDFKLQPYTEMPSCKIFELEMEYPKDK